LAGRQLSKCDRVSQVLTIALSGSVRESQSQMRFALQVAPLLGGSRQPPRPRFDSGGRSRGNLPRTPLELSRWRGGCCYCGGRRNQTQIRRGTRREQRAPRRDSYRPECRGAKGENSGLAVVPFGKRFNGPVPTEHGRARGADSHQPAQLLSKLRGRQDSLGLGFVYAGVDVKGGRILLSLTKSRKPIVLIADTAVDMLLVEQMISTRD